MVALDTAPEPRVSALTLTYPYTLQGVTWASQEELVADIMATPPSADVGLRDLERTAGRHENGLPPHIERRALEVIAYVARKTTAPRQRKAAARGPGRPRENTAAREVAADLMAIGAALMRGGDDAREAARALYNKAALVKRAAAQGDYDR